MVFSAIGRAARCPPRPPRTLLALLSALLFVPARTDAQPTEPLRPNVLLIVSDDQAWSDYGFMGHPHLRTPNLNRLAREGKLFTRGYVVSSLCRASLATIVTGLYPHEHGITSNDPPLPAGMTLGQAMRDPRFLADRRRMADRFHRNETLPRLLEKRGYESFQSGKWWEGDACRCFGEAMTHGDPARGGRHGDEGLKIGRESLEPVLGFMDRCVAKARPFFVWYAPFLPHAPHNPPERLLAFYREKTPSLRLARYWAMCEWMDETVGAIMERVERLGQRERTLVVFLADNGWIQSLESDDFAPRSKRSPYDGGLRTPIVLHWPSRIQPGRDDVPASSVDIAPTILRAAGLKPTGRMQGRNLLAPAEAENRGFAFGAVFTHNAIDIGRPERNLQYRWMVSPSFKLILPNAANEPGKEPELYDLQSDPWETVNLARERERQADVIRMRNLIDQWWSPGRTGPRPPPRRPDGRTNGPSAAACLQFDDPRVMIRRPVRARSAAWSVRAVGSGAARPLAPFQESPHGEGGQSSSGASDRVQGPGGVRGRRTRA